MANWCSAGGYGESRYAAGKGSRWSRSGGSLAYESTFTLLPDNKSYFLKSLELQRQRTSGVPVDAMAAAWKASKELGPAEATLMPLENTLRREIHERLSHLRNHAS
jgi:hypothetical protein